MQKKFKPVALGRRSTAALALLGLSSYDVERMKKNADGNVDIYFGPNAPAGLEANWIPTEGKKPAPFLRIYDGDERFWSRSFTLPDVERVQ